ncbi:Calx-beta domain-containing protein [Verrucomicrobiota bacterium sgz303538]
MKSLPIEPLEARYAPATLTIAPASVLEGDSGTTKLIFTVTLHDASATPVTVDYATEDGTALVSDSDYEALSGTLIFGAGETTKTIEVNVLGDVKGEADETFKMKLSNASEGVTISTPEVLGTIKNDGIHLVGPTSFLEGDSGTHSVTYSVRRETLTTDQALTVSYSTLDGTATTADNDYVAASGNLTFAAGETEKTFAVDIKGDTTSEADETFKVKLTTASTAEAIPTPETTVTILNDGGVHFVGPVSIFEGDDTHAVTFTLRREGTSTEPLTVHYTTADGTAIAGDDYEAAVGDLTFAAGETQKTFTVNIKGDLIGEADETFKILLSGGEGFSTTTPETEITIKNDGIHLAGPSSTLEGDTGSHSVTYTVLRETLTPEQQVTVHYATADGTATIADSDYVAKSGDLVFAAGETQKTFDVEVKGDITSESDETFKIALSTTSSEVVSTPETSVTILNDGGVHFVGPVSIFEGDDTHAVTFTLRREGAPSQPLTVHYSTADGTAIAGDDYEAATGDIVFAAGETQKTFTINIKGDLTAENDETFKILLSGGEGFSTTTPETEITIKNDGLHINSASILEGDSGTSVMTFDVIRETFDLGPATVKYTTEDGTATVANRDYQKELGTLVFAQGETIKHVNVNIIGDLVGEDDETFKVKLSEVTGATLTIAEATGTILNDAKLKITSGSVLEGDSGTTSLGLNVTLIEGPVSRTVTVKYTTEDLAAGEGHATAGEDYVAVTDPATLTFSPGETSKTISISINGDTVGEADEVFNVKLQEATGATIVTSEATGTILNDAKFTFVSDTPPASGPEQPNRSQNEGDFGSQSMTFKVKGTELAPNVVTKVNYSTANGTGSNPALGGEDYQVTSGTLEFSSEGEIKEIAVPIIGDLKFEADEVFTVSLTGADHSHAALPAAATGTIVSDDILTISNVTILEGNSGSTKAVFTVTLNKAVDSGKEFWVDFNTVDGTAFGDGTAGKLADYKTTGGTLKIAAGKSVGTIEVEVFGDLNYEAAENTFKVALSNGRYVNASNTTETEAVNIGVREGTGTIVESTATNNKDALPTISISDSKFLEGVGLAQFTLTLSAATDFDVTVDLSTIAGSAGAGTDFEAFANKIVTIPAGSKTFTVSVPIIQDSITEIDETFSLKINSAKLGTDNLVITRSTATGTIVNDEQYITVDTPQIFTEGSSGSTGNFLVFKVRLMNSADNTPYKATNPVVVSYNTEDLSAVSGGPLPDFIAQSGTIEFQPGQSEVEIKIAIVGDLQHEDGPGTGDDLGKEKFNLKLTGAQGAKLGQNGESSLTAVGTIQDDDPLPVITLTNEMKGGGVTEGGQVVIKVKLDRASDHEITVPFTLENGTATGGASTSTDPKDYINGTGLKVVIPAGQTEAVITVNTVDDALSEAPLNSALTAPETFKVKIDTDHVVGATVGTGEVTANIFDNDPLPTVSISDYVVVEGNPSSDPSAPGKVAKFKVTLSAVSGQDVILHYETIDKTATAGSDYVAKSGTLVIPAGTLSKEIEVPIISDLDPEADESFLVRLSQEPNTPVTALIVGQQATGTILTDDTQYEVWFKNGDTWSQTLEVTEENGTGGDQKITVVVRRTGDLSQAGSVRFTTEDGANAAGDLYRNATGTGDRADFQFLSKVLNFAPNAQESEAFQITINKDNYYEGTEEFRIRLSEAVNGIVSEANAKMGTVKILDNEEKPTITFEKTEVVVNEGGMTKDSSGNTVPQQTQVVFKIKLSGVDETGTVTMHFATEDIDAVSSGAKKDYEAVTKDISFLPGETEKTQAVIVYGDNRDEYDETFRVRLSEVHGGGATFSGNATELTATGKIIDDDAEAIVSISDLSKVKSGSGTSVVYEGTTYAESDLLTEGKFFLVSVIGETDKPVTVKYYTVDGTAKTGQDFVGITEANAKTLTFNPDDTSKVQKVFIPMIDDAVAEGDETFQVRLKDATNAGLGDTGGTATITGDNDNPIVSIDDVQVIEGNDPSAPVKAKFTVRLATAAERDVVVNFATQDGTAKASGIFADYIARQGSITFAPGETSKEIEIDILGDIYQEGYYVAAQGSGDEAIPAHIVYEEAFSVKLSGNGLTFAKDTGTGTIKNGDDSIVGVGVNDVKVVENLYNSSGTAVASTADFTVELSVPFLQQSSAFTAALRSGTAAKGEDFSDFDSTNPGSITFAAGSTSGKFSVKITADTAFETSEHFFLNLLNMPAGVQAAKGEARGTIFSEDIRQVDAQTVQWIDVDGDLVTLKVSKGALFSNNLKWLTNTSGAIAISPNGGRTLQTLDLTPTIGATQFQGANITITAERQPGFTGDVNGELGDGRVNIGYVKAGNFVNDGSFYGVDLGTVKIDGDLGRIDVGDRILNGISLKKLDVFSIGLHPNEEGLITTSNGQPSANISSYILGAVGSIRVENDVSGAIRVTGARFGDIGSLKIGGVLQGTEFQTSGSIQFSGTLGNAVIGQIIGGSGEYSGRLDGDVVYGATINKIVVKGDIAGGGANSGVISAGKIGSISVGRVLGGTGDDSGGIRAATIGRVSIKTDVVGGEGDRSALILGDSSLSKTGKASIGTADVGGRIIGGAGENSGIVGSDGAFGAAIVRGNVPKEGAVLLPDTTGAVTGGDGVGSGRVHSSGALGRLILGHDGSVQSLVGGNGTESGKITAGSIGNAVLKGDIQGAAASATGIINVINGIKSLRVEGDLHGGDSKIADDSGAAAAVNTSGAIIAGSINSLRITGDVIAGVNHGAGLQGSGSIAVQGPLKNLQIGGSLLGNEDASVSILAFGGAKAAAISTLHVGKNVEFANITAGVSIRSGSAGYPVNADAQIGSVIIDGNVKGLNITAGGNTGQDGRFGTADDQVLSNSLAQINDPKVYSRIASVIIRGQITAVPGETEGTTSPYGIVAQQIGSIRYGTTVPGQLIKVALTPGAGNDKADRPDVEIKAGTGFRAFELPLA